MSVWVWGGELRDRFALASQFGGLLSRFRAYCSLVKTSLAGDDDESRYMQATEKARLVLHLDLQLFLFWQVEKGPPLFNDIVDQRFRDTGILDVKKPYIEKSISERV